MAYRNDALVLAAPYVLDVRDAASAAGIVGTVGTVRVEPNAGNVIPGRVELAVEIRGLDEAVLDRVEAELSAAAGRRGGELRRLSASSPVPCHPTLMGAVEAACEALGLARRRLPSGAGHDAMVIGVVAPQAMVFVPSRGGVSHSPEELTTPEQCADGTRVLLGALLEADRLLDAESTL
jgi:N-carbamoyl-L-amino-acid hydrolase